MLPPPTSSPRLPTTNLIQTCGEAHSQGGGGGEARGSDSSDSCDSSDGGDGGSDGGGDSQAEAKGRVYDTINRESSKKADKITVLAI